MVYRKYGININPAEFKVVHRLAGGRILFALHSRMCGLGYDTLVKKVNTNPNPGVEVYLSIQLFEPYSDLFYIARRLKSFKIISYYRIDENGYTYIAINENSKAFKFTNLEQLKQLNINVPQKLYDEIYQMKLKTADLESQKAAQIINRALEPRPVIQQTVPSGSMNQNGFHQPVVPQPSDSRQPQHSFSNLERAQQIHQCSQPQDTSSNPGGMQHRETIKQHHLESRISHSANTQGFRFPGPTHSRRPSTK